MRPWGFALTIGIGVTCTIWLLPPGLEGRLRRWLLGPGRTLSTDLEVQMIFLPASSCALIFWGLPLGAGALGLLLDGRDAALLTAGCAMGMVLGLGRLLRSIRRRRIAQQLPEGLDSISAGLRAGLSVRSTLEQILPDLPHPLRLEMARLLREIHLGGSVEEAFRSMAQRVDISATDMLATGMEVLHPRGGNLAEHLQRLAAFLRDQARMEDRIRTLTTGSRTQGLLSCALPPLLLLFLSRTSPAQVDFLLHSPQGKLLLATVGSLTALGGYLVLRFSRVET